ncbi:MAG: carbon starvation CstA family protein, partial [Bryobacteraceae bacterium]
MNTFPILIGALCVYAIAYRYYSAFIAAKALALDDRRITPAHQFRDGHNFIASGAVLAGCVQDFTVLAASVRHRGRSLADIARTEVSPFAGLVTMIAVLFILLVSL